MVVSPLPRVEHIGQGVVHRTVRLLHSSADVKILEVQEEPFIVSLQLPEQVRPDHRETACHVLDIDRFGKILVQHKVLIHHRFQLFFKDMASNQSTVNGSPLTQHLDLSAREPDLRCDLSDIRILLHIRN